MIRMNMTRSHER